MAEILSQQDLDALILSLTAEDKPQPSDQKKREARHSHHKRLVRVYDFRRPDKFSRDQIRTVEMLHETIARLGSTYLAAQVRSMVNIVLSSVDQMTFEEFVSSLDNPTYVATVTMEPLKGNMFVAVDLPIAFVMVDRLFGGSGATSQVSRPLTEIETAIIDRLTQGLLGTVREAWAFLVSIDPRIQSTASNPSFIQNAVANEMTIVVRYDVRVAKSLGAITLCIPFVSIEPILPKLSAKNWFTVLRSASSEKNEEDALAGRLQLVEANVIAQLGKAALTVRDVLSLEPGDIIQLESRVKDEMLVMVENCPKFAATPGRTGQRMSFRVTRQLKEEDVRG